MALSLPMALLASGFGGHQRSQAHALVQDAVPDGQQATRGTVNSLLQSMPMPRPASGYLLTGNDIYRSPTTKP